MELVNDEKLSFDQMIEQLDGKGIKFEKTSKNNAKEILMNSNFYYKVRSFRKNFPKNNKGEYTNLDFFMLNDLATLDMRLRYILIHMCLDLEHTLKTRIVRDVTLDDEDNGKIIVEKFLKSEKTKKTLNSFYCPISSPRHPNHGIFKKYNGKTPPIWVFCELITFGDLVAFIEFIYNNYKKNPDYYLPLQKNLRFVKNIRNLTAHNSPILNEIAQKGQETFETNKFLNDYLKSVEYLSKQATRKKLSNTKIHDLCALLCIYDAYIVSPKMKENRYNELSSFMERSKRNKELYKKHDNLVSVYTFFKKIIDFMLKKL